MWKGEFFMYDTLRAVLVIVLLLFFSAGTQASVVKVIDSPIDPAIAGTWMGVAAGMGHATVLLPPTSLDVTTWIPGTDILIITDPYYPYTTLNFINVLDAYLAGVSIYIQTEEFHGFPSNMMWEFVVNFSGTAGFHWVGPLGMPVFRANLSGPVATQPTAMYPLKVMFNGCVGTHAGPIGGVITNLIEPAATAEVGFLFNEPTVPGTRTMATNSDVEWIIPAGPDIAWMENYIDVLDAGIPLDHLFGIFPTGLTSLPAGGGTMPYEVFLINLAGSAFPTTLWVRVFLPSTALYPPPVAGPTVVVIPPFATLGPFPSPGTLPALSVPPFAPPGEYVVQSVMTDGFPGYGIAYDTNIFTFVKTVAGADGIDYGPGDLSGNMFAEVEEKLDFSSMSGEEASAEFPVEFALSQPYPNPFNPSTTVNIGLGEASHLSVIVFDIQGREVASLANDQFAAGKHSFSFNANGLASGVYMLRAVSGSNVQTRKLVLMQ
jgi:Secretion system C-terminal sorting domain